MKKSDFEYLNSLLKHYAGWEFSEERLFILDMKMYNFVMERGYLSLEEMIADLKGGNKTLTEDVVDTMMVSDTSFFRDAPVFKGFEEVLVPYLKQNAQSRKLRIWSLGCSTGQEVYSIAIVLNRHFPKKEDWVVEITGTDLSNVSIVKAQKGAYSTIEVQMGMNARTILDNFTLENGKWHIHPDIAKLCGFRRYNMLDDITFTEKFDAVFCRNVMKLFDPAMQRQIAGKIRNNLKPEGFLYIGAGERIPSVAELYDAVADAPCLFRAKAGVVLGGAAGEMPVAGGTPSAAAGGDAGAMPSFARPKG